MIPERHNGMTITSDVERVTNKFADELRKWWSFDDRQIHTHSWHSREDFIERELPKLLRAAMRAARKAG